MNGRRLRTLWNNAQNLQETAAPLPISNFCCILIADQTDSRFLIRVERGRWVCGNRKKGGGVMFQALGVFEYVLGISEYVFYILGCVVFVDYLRRQHKK